MKKLTKPDMVWLRTLLDVVEYLYQEYPELFSEEDEEALAIAREIIGRSDEDSNTGH